MKINAKINETSTIEFTPNSNNILEGNIGEKPFIVELVKGGRKGLLVSKNGKKYFARLLDLDVPNKKVTLKIDGDRFEIELKDEYDNLLHSLGMDAASTKKVNELKAPMPGVVVDVVVNVGDRVVKDDPLVVLEAMKMENMLKSPADGIISSINIEKGETVEKNKVLVNFE